MPKFEIGDVIHHRRYGYRGVIIGIDPECEASDEWYERNQTQPRRNQPWYHVLRHQGWEHYVAEENLEPDDTGEKIDHPLIPIYFPSFHEGKYYQRSRN